MSFRLRVIAMVMFIAVAATAATAWLTLSQASRQLGESIIANQQQIMLITSELGDFARTRGSWDGIATKLRDLSQKTGQRIRVTTSSGSVIADSDLLAGAPAREVAEPPLLIDPRPIWQPTMRLDIYWGSIAKLIRASIDEYRSGIRYAACVTMAGASVRLTAGNFGVPHFDAVGASRSTVYKCSVESKAVTANGSLSPDFDEVVRRCLSAAAQPESCLRDEFTREISEFAPSPLQVYIGAAEDPPPRLAGDSVATTAVVIMTTAIGASWLLSRRVLRPIASLTAAARRVGEGELAERVPVGGHDELAELGRSFNRMADSLQRSEERQRRMIADVAHELRTPLANLRGYLEALKDGVLPPSPELFASLHDEALLQQRIVNDLQDLALAEAGALAYQKVDLDLTELVTTSGTAHAALVAAAGVNLVVAGDGPLWAYGDPDRLRQVIGNLVRNALAATAPGGTITLAVTAVHGKPTITVTDTGTGIAPADLAHLFDRFWRGDHARTRSPESTVGSGLGLAIARQIIADHNGAITVTSRLGHGTTFAILLPAEHAAVGI